jgi:hypothetical protein
MFFVTKPVRINRGALSPPGEISAVAGMEAAFCPAPRNIVPEIAVCTPAWAKKGFTMLKDTYIGKKMSA